MGGLEIRLLGQPVVLHDGRIAPPPRGAKVWALLAFLALSERPRSRQELAGLLCAEADDPLGALRWNLAALRRLLDLPEAVKGEQVSLDLPAGTRIDVRVLEHGGPAAGELQGLGRDLLEGLSFGDSPAFETWLATERRRLHRHAADALRESALVALARGTHDDAARAAAALVAMDPLDEGHHALLIRCHCAAGDTDAASAQLQRCRAILQDELGVPPGPAVLAAARSAESRNPDTAACDRQTPAARTLVGWQAFLAGAVDHGIDVGRSAVEMADRSGETLNACAARLALGAMLAGAVRGWDESAAAFSAAEHLAGQAGSESYAALARSGLAGIEMMRGSYEAAARHARVGLARSDEPSARASNLTYLAASLADQGHLGQAAEAVSTAVECALAGGEPFVIDHAVAHGARIHLMADEPDEARAVLDLGERNPAMPTLDPWHDVMRAEIHVRDGRPGEAISAARAAAAVAATTGVEYQQALALRVEGLALAARGDVAEGIEQLGEALRVARAPRAEGYPYHWMIGFTLDSLRELTAGVDADASRRWATAQREHAEALGMGYLSARAGSQLDADPPPEGP